MKQTNNYLLITILMSMIVYKSFAYDIAVDNNDGVTIYYNYINDGKNLEVAKAKYSGKVNIPEEVVYMNRTRKVTSIGMKAFFDCDDLLYVTIPKSIASIGAYAFSGCSNLDNIVIPNSVTSVDMHAFEECSGLTNVTIGSSVTNISDYLFFRCSNLTSVIVPNSVTKISSYAFAQCYALNDITLGNNVATIGQHAFSYCTGLKSIVIPNSVTSIFDSAFSYCSSLNTVTIGNNVSSIGKWCFYECKGLASVTIPNSVDTIDHSAFSDCIGLKSLTLGNNVVSIGSMAFAGCSGITSVIIPNSVTAVGEGAFYNCSLDSVVIGNNVSSLGSNSFGGVDIPVVISMNSKPTKIKSDVFTTNTYYNATLKVPDGTKEKYKSTDGWKDFVYIEEKKSTPSGPMIPICETPTISYNDGKLLFKCATEGATCVSSISDSDISSYTTNEVQLSITYNISVYALKEGYNNSEMVTATLCWIDANPKTEGISNSVNQIRANAVLVQSNDGKITISGAEDDTIVSVYGINGIQAGSEISKYGQAIINTNLSSGEIGIVKIGEKTIKILIK